MIQTKNNSIIENMSYLTLGQVLKALIRLLAFSIVTRSLSIDQYGQVLTVIAFCEFFKFSLYLGCESRKKYCRDINNIDQILTSKSGIRNLIAFQLFAS